MLRITVRLYCADEIAMGPGKADLLEAIGREGSISAAGRAMGLSYRRAWMLVDTMNRCWVQPLVATTPGSARGHGARVTPLGTQVLAGYRALVKAVEMGAQAAGGALDHLLRATPLAHQTGGEKADAEGEASPPPA